MIILTLSINGDTIDYNMVIAGGYTMGKGVNKKVNKADEFSKVLDRLDIDDKDKLLVSARGLLRAQNTVKVDSAKPKPAKKKPAAKKVTT
jgi:hypothetical protein